jgi:hypothetical protein
MSLPAETNSNYMREVWSKREPYDTPPQKRIIQEIMHDTAPKHDFKKQIELHEKIRNDEDYDDWSYGTEPNYGSSWK